MITYLYAPVSEHYLFSNTFSSKNIFKNYFIVRSLCDRQHFQHSLYETFNYCLTRRYPYKYMPVTSCRQCFTKITNILTSNWFYFMWHNWQIVHACIFSLWVQYCTISFEVYLQTDTYTIYRTPWNLLSNITCIWL